MLIKNTLTVLLPAWWLPNGTIKASNQELEGASSSCERWGIWFAALVVVAVIAELIISWAEPPYLLFLKLSAFADAAIAIGIVGEIGLGTIWNNRIQNWAIMPGLRKVSPTELQPWTYGIANVSNVAIEFLPRFAEELTPAATALVDALNSIGIAAKIEPSPVSGISGRGNVIHLLIGTKE